MAQAKRRGRPASAKNAKASPRSEKSAQKRPRRREVLGAVCFVLAVFSFIGCFSLEGAFIGIFTGFVKRLVGHGYYALPPALLLCSVILGFHRGRPVRLRVFSALLLTVVTGAFAHLIIPTPDYIINTEMMTSLWRDGEALKSGGVISGAITEVFTWLFSGAGTAVLLIFISIILLMSTFHITIAGIIASIKNRERREYIPEPEPERQLYRADRADRMDKRRVQENPKRRRAIDIPIDYDETQSVPEYFDKPKGGLFKGTPRVKTPDQLINEYTAPDEQPSQPEDSSAGEEQEDVPLDIPFMESKRGASASKTSQPAVGKQAPETKASIKESASAALQAEAAQCTPEAEYAFPPVELLSVGAPKSRVGDDEVRTNSDRLEAAFRSFGVNVSILNATRGPSVTRYEAELEAGVKLSKLTSLADDIALSLGTSGVRIAAMPNKISTVGVEVPNRSVSKVCLRDIIESQPFNVAKSKLTFAIGMDISGEAIIGNVSKLPHMLVAGTTGSGKSVCLNSIILSILYKATPEDVRFIMIDPKMVEFKVYNSIPHLLVPVVTDVKKASGALQWAVFEMMKRYKLFSEVSARDIDGYNQTVRKQTKDARNPETSDLKLLPQVIIVIDELADLMLMAAKEVEESVCRVAQMGRAAGMHLIIATQSPRADVITGLMKANIPSRIAFKVSSALESRIILDAGGNADKLVGNGDMLYAPIGMTKPIRVQGTWVSDKEREKVVEYVSSRGESQYSEEVMDEIEKAASEKPSGEKQKDEPDNNDHDELLPQAVDVIFETGQASVSMLQRRLKLGYSRAARIVDQMEQMGIVGPFEGSKPRAIMITKDQWRQMQYMSGKAPTDRIEYDLPDNFDEDEEDED